MESKRAKKQHESIPLPREFTPTKEQLNQALAVITASVRGGLCPDYSGGVQRDNHEQVHAIGPGAMATGHGLATSKKAQSVTAYEAFIEGVRELVGTETWQRLEVLDQAAWIQVRGDHGRIYVAKNTTAISRVESTLEPHDVPDVPMAPLGARNASEPDRVNGRIKSWLRADVGVVAQAVRLIAGSPTVD